MTTPGAESSTADPEGQAGDWIVGKRCSVRVPATSANLGPGFDSLGLALGLYDVVEAEIVPHGLDITVDGEGEGQVPLDDRHLVVRSMARAAQAWGLSPWPGLRLRAHNAIPHGRGLGSSAAAIVAGLSLVHRLAPERSGLRDLLTLATRLEGHPDNAAAALLGGLTIAWCESASSGSSGHDSSDASGHDSASATARAVRVAPHLLVEPVVLVAPERLETSLARAVLPEFVSHADAARTAGRSALLVHALTSAPELLMPATEEWLHQRPRAAAMPETIALVDDLRARGYAAVVSGAGPSVLVLCVGDPDSGEGEPARRLLDAPPPGWAAVAPGVAHQGTRAGFLRAGSRERPSVLE